MINKLKFLDKNKRYNIFIVRTPFQFINAYESMEFFKTENNILVIIDNGAENNKIQLTNLIYDGLWSEIIRFGVENKTNFFNYIKLINRLKKITIENLFIGSGLNDMQKILVANIDSEKTCFFDSGTNTMTTYNDFVKDSINNFSFKKARFRLFGLKTKIRRTIDFFTMFDLKGLPTGKIFKNEYNFMKKKFTNKNNIHVNEVYLIGQKFVSDDTLDKEIYFKFLDFVIQEYSDYKINYLMHRTEKIDYLINGGYNKKFNIIKSTMPGELFFLSLGFNPKYIIGTVSSLIISLKYIMRDVNIVSYRFKIEDFKKNKDLYELEYKNMENNKIIIKNYGDEN